MKRRNQSRTIFATSHDKPPPCGGRKAGAFISGDRRIRSRRPPRSSFNPERSPARRRNRNEFLHGECRQFLKPQILQLAESRVPPRFLPPASPPRPHPERIQARRMPVIRKRIQAQINPMIKLHILRRGQRNKLNAPQPRPPAPADAKCSRAAIPCRQHQQGATKERPEEPPPIAAVPRH